MDKVRKFFKSKLGFAICLSLVFCAVQIPLVLRHELTLPEAEFYQQYFAPLNISYSVARFAPLAFTTIIVFLLSWLLPIRRISKIFIVFSSLLFYFNSVLLIWPRLIPLGRDLIYSNPIEFFDAANEALFHTFLPVLQLCLIPIVIYLLDLVFHFKFLRKLELVKLAKRHKISGAVVFLIPITLSIPNAIISGMEDYNHQYNDYSATSGVVDDLNKLPANATIAIASDMRDFATIYAPLLTNGQSFYELDKEASTENNFNLPDIDDLYILIYTSACYFTKDYPPMSSWEYLGLIRQLKTERAYDFYRIKKSPKEILMVLATRLELAQL